MQRKLGSTWKSRWVLAALVLIGVGLFQARYRLALVVGTSMQPSLATGDLLLIDKAAFRRVPPARWDVVVARLSGEFIVKRIVGLPGETLALREGSLYLEGVALSEPHPVQHGSLEIGRGRLSATKYALLGDNRDIGAEQSVHGLVSAEDIVGKVVWTLRSHRIFGAVGTSLP